MDRTPGDWPEKRALFGVPISVTTYHDAVAAVMHAAKNRRSACVSNLAVHGVVTARRDSEFRNVVSEFELLTCDGHPVRWAMNRFAATRMLDRVCGTDLMDKLCAAAGREGIPVYLYGSSARVSQSLSVRLKDCHKGLTVVGAEPSLFRPLTDEQLAALIARIVDSGAQLVFLGLGCPLQERFALTLRAHIDAPIVCSGAAFDFLSGNKPRAPLWMRHSGLEWLFRLLNEPRRLFARYASTNTIFLALYLAAIVNRPTAARKRPH